MLFLFIDRSQEEVLRAKATITQLWRNTSWLQEIHSITQPSSKSFKNRCNKKSFKNSSCVFSVLIRSLHQFSIEMKVTLTVLLSLKIQNWNKSSQIYCRRWEINQRRLCCANVNNNSKNKATNCKKVRIAMAGQLMKILGSLSPTRSTLQEGL